MHMYYNNLLIILYLTLAHNQKLHQIVVTTYDAKLLLNTDYQDDITSAKIKTALYDLNDEFGITSINSLAIVIEPANARCVRATRDIKANELKLVPVTPAVSFTKNSKVAPPESSVTISAIQDANKMPTMVNSDGRTVYLAYKVPAMAKAAANERAKPQYEFVQPFWLVQAVLQYEMSNMTLQPYRVPVGKSSVVVPILSNRVPLKNGDTLTIFQAPGVKHKFNVPDNVEECELPKRKARKQQ